MGTDNEESLHFLIIQTAYDYNSVVNKPEVINDFETGGIDKLASAESVKQLFQFANDGKESIVTEINAKGITATIAETFSSLANLKYNSGNLETGTIPNKGAQTYANQFLGTLQTILGSANLVPENIKDGVNFLWLVYNHEQHGIILLKFLAYLCN